MTVKSNSAYFLEDVAMASTSTLGVLPISSVLTVCSPPTTTLSTYRAAASTGRIVSASRRQRVVISELLPTVSPSFLPQIAVDSCKTGSAGSARAQNVFRVLSGTRKNSPLLTATGASGGGGGDKNNLGILKILPSTINNKEPLETDLETSSSSTSSRWQRRSNFPTFSTLQVGGNDFSRASPSAAKSGTFEKTRRESVESALAKAAVRLETKVLLQEEEEANIQLKEGEQLQQEKEDREESSDNEKDNKKEPMEVNEKITRTFRKLESYLDDQADVAVSKKKRKRAKKSKKKTVSEMSRSKKKSGENKNSFTRSFTLSLADDHAKSSDNIVMYSSRYNKVNLSNASQESNKAEGQGLILQHQASSVLYNQSSFREATMIYGSRIDTTRPEYRSSTTVPPNKSYPGLNSIISKTQIFPLKVEGNLKPQVRTVKVYQSEKQSAMIKDQDCGGYFPAAPPATPTPSQLQKYIYVPSMNDIRSQRAFRAKLQTIEQKAKKENEKKRVELRKAEKLQMKDEIVEIKQKQRQQIYALNKIMSQLENENYQNFRESQKQH